MYILQKQIGNIHGRWYNKKQYWRVGEEVTRESAKLLCAGSIPARASY